jgi:hypothetical protein
LFCDIYSEKVDIWQRVKQGGFDQFHFLVVHLSFLEAFRDEHDQKMYSENDIGEFIEREVLQGKRFRIILSWSLPLDVGVHNGGMH